MIRRLYLILVLMTVFSAAAHGREILAYPSGLILKGEMNYKNMRYGITCFVPKAKDNFLLLIDSSSPEDYGKAFLIKKGSPYLYTPRENRFHSLPEENLNIFLLIHKILTGHGLKTEKTANANNKNTPEVPLRDVLTLGKEKYTINYTGWNAEGEYLIPTAFSLAGNNKTFYRFHSIEAIDIPGFIFTRSYVQFINGKQ